MNPQERILFLIDEIEKHNIHYYIKNDPIIADYDYDILSLSKQSVFYNLRKNENIIYIS